VNVVILKPLILEGMFLDATPAISKRKGSMVIDDIRPTEELH
jgi:hypothetical protein